MNTSKLQDRRVWIGGGGVLVLLIAAASWLFLIHPKLSDASDMRSQTADTDLQNSQLAASNAALARKFAHLADLRTSLTKATDAVPPINGYPEFTREVNELASDVGVTIKSITIGAPTAVVASTSTATGSTASTASGSSTASTNGTTDSTASSTSTSAPVASASQYQSSVSMTVDGGVAQTIEFLGALQSGPRNALVSASQFAIRGNRAELTVQAQIFTVPMTTTQLAQLTKLLSTSN